MKKTISLIFFISLQCFFAYSQSNCDEKLRSAKNSIIAIVNSGGGNNKINQTASDLMVNMALNCPEKIKEFNKFIEDISKTGKTENGLDGSLPAQGTYMTNKERDENSRKFFENQNTNSSSQNSNGTTLSMQKENPLGPKTYGVGNMKGDGYAELPFNDWDDEEGRNNPNRNVVNTDKPLVMNGTQRKDYVLNEQNIGNNADIVKKMDNLANTLETLQANGNEKYTIIDNFNALQRKLNANQISASEATIEYNAIKKRVDDIQSGKNQGYRPDTYLSNSPMNLDVEIKKFEAKLALVPEDLKPDLLAKANSILKTETNKQEAARKIASLMKEFERNNGNISLKNITSNRNYDCISRNSDKLSSYFESLLKNVSFFHKGTSKDCLYYITVNQKDVEKVKQILNNNPNVTNLRYEPDGNFTWY